VGPDTRYYLAIGKVIDGAGRPPGEVDQRMRRAMLKAVAALAGYAVAPARETVEQAEQLLARHASVKAFYLAPKLAAPVYAGGGLTVKVSVAMFTYPGRALLGEYSVKLTQPGVEERDPAAENELIEMAGDQAIQRFDATAARL
jgi:hypothetical protein